MFSGLVADFFRLPFIVEQVMDIWGLLDPFSLKHLPVSAGHAVKKRLKGEVIVLSCYMQYKTPQTESFKIFGLLFYFLLDNKNCLGLL